MTLIDELNEAFAGPAWHGPALKSALRGVSETLAAWRPAPRRHNTWEIALHAAYWKHVVRQRLTGERDRFPHRGRNWFVRPAKIATGREARDAWAADLALLDAEHERFLAAVNAIEPRGLGRIVKAGQTAEENIRGIAMHDVYHAGQIQLLKALRT